MPAQVETAPTVLDANEELISDAESHWNDLPKGVKDLLPIDPGLFIPTEAIADPTPNYGLDGIIGISLNILPLFQQDDEYDWNMWESVTSSYVLATDFLLKRKNQDAIVMMFVAALLEECLARGFTVVYNTFRGFLFQPEIRWEWLFQTFACFHYAVEISQSRKAMAAFLKQWLDTKQGCNQWVHRLDKMTDQDLSAAPIHFFNTFGVVPKGSITIYIKCSSKLLIMEAYNDISLQWLFNYAVAGINHSSVQANSSLFKLLNGRSRIKAMQFPAPAYTKTLRELGFEDGDTVGIVDGRQFTKEVDSVLPAQKKHGPKETKRRKTKPRGKRKPNKAPTHNQEPSQDALRELHSKAMEPVLNELRPKLKKIKERINALSLVKDRPKERSPNARRKDKASATNSERSLVPIVNSSVGGKAGRTAYPILVGEVTNLFKTAQLRPRKALPRITLDLHGCPRHKALELLDKGLDEWIDVAMKGEYPFVVAVDIICGGGNQVLSEVVAQFIRNSPQIANRPKSIK